MSTLLQSLGTSKEDKKSAVLVVSYVDEKIQTHFEGSVNILPTLIVMAIKDLIPTILQSAAKDVQMMVTGMRKIANVLEQSISAD